MGLSNKSPGLQLNIWSSSQVEMLPRLYPSFLSLHFPSEAGFSNYLSPIYILTTSVLFWNSAISKTMESTRYHFPPFDIMTATWFFTDFSVLKVWDRSLLSVSHEKLSLWDISSLKIAKFGTFETPNLFDLLA